jgi:hypothetical protein
VPEGSHDRPHFTGEKAAALHPPPPGSLPMTSPRPLKPGPLHPQTLEESESHPTPRAQVSPFARSVATGRVGCNALSLCPQTGLHSPSTWPSQSPSLNRSVRPPGGSSRQPEVLGIQPDFSGFQLCKIAGQGDNRTSRVLPSSLTPLSNVPMLQSLLWVVWVRACELHGSGDLVTWGQAPRRP